MKKYIINPKISFLALAGALTVLVIASIFWVISATQKAVMVTDSIAEKAENQTKPTTATPTISVPAETPIEPPASNTNTDNTSPAVQLTDAEAGSLTVVVNKKHKLPSDYAPAIVSIRGGQLRQEAASATEQLFLGAETAGNQPKIISGYRSYSRQQQVYAGYVADSGQQQADTFSARPGHSEHQTGLGVDIGNGDGNCDLMICFGNTQLGQWLASNAYTYGFIVRYPEGKEDLTGYQYEPWHLRYVGVAEATAIYASGQTMDQYYNVPAGQY